jgi:hypothetical protein
MCRIRSQSQSQRKQQWSKMEPEKIWPICGIGADAVPKEEPALEPEPAPVPMPEPESETEQEPTSAPPQNQS